MTYQKVEILDMCSTAQGSNPTPNSACPLGHLDTIIILYF